MTFDSQFHYPPNIHAWARAAGTGCGPRWPELRGPDRLRVELPESAGSWCGRLPQEPEGRGTLGADEPRKGRLQGSTVGQLVVSVQALLNGVIGGNGRQYRFEASDGLLYLGTLGCFQVKIGE